MPYNPDCKTDSRVWINDEERNVENRLPVADVDVWLRREGPLDIGRYAEVTFASPFRGEDYAPLFDGLDPDNQNQWDTLKIEVKDHATDEYSLVFHGMVTAVGNGVGPEQLWKARAQGPALFADKIAASQSFSDASVRDVLKYCAFEFAEKLPLTIPVETNEVPTQDVRNTQTNSAGEPETDIVNQVLDNIGEVIDIWAGAGNSAEEGDSIVNEVLSSKTFQSNRHTIADVVNWLKGKTGTRLWFEPTQQGAILVGSTEPTATGHMAHYEGGQTAIINNDALVEINPANTIKVQGRTPNTLFEVGEWDANIPGSHYFTAVARHKPLYERAGKTEYLAETDQPSDANTSTEVKNEAKSLLKERIDEATAGDMQTLLKSPIKPFDTITARPTCQSSPATNVQPITYEVSRVHHQIRPGDSDEDTMTELNVGVHAALDDIEIIDSWEEKA